jgi:hypothetical protein
MVLQRLDEEERRRVRDDIGERAAAFTDPQGRIILTAVSTVASCSGR